MASHAVPHTDPHLATNIDQVRLKELRYIARRRAATGQEPPEVGEIAKDLVGLSLSGGGIRSATTNLGVLQALSRMRILPLVDYVSTVSGGGYIGACLSALLSEPRDTPPGKKKYRSILRSERRFSTQWKKFPFNPDMPSSGEKECGPRSRVTIGKNVVRHLRTHGNFLIARRGLLKRDALRSVGHLLTGAVYHVLATLLVLFMTALTAMGIAHWMEPDIHDRLSESPTPSSATVATVTAPPGDPVFEVRQDEEATWQEEFSHRFIVAWGDVVYDFGHTRLGLALAWGAGATVLVFLLFLLAINVPSKFKQLFPRLLTKAARGESIEDRFERKLVVISAAIVTVAVIVACALLEDGETGRAGWIVEPLLVLAGARVSNFLLYALAARAGDFLNLQLWSRTFRSLWGSFQAVTVYGIYGMLLFACLPVAAYAAAEVSPWVLIAPLLSLVSGRLLVTEAAGEAASRLRIPKGAMHFVLGVVVALFIGFVVLEAAAASVHWGFDRPLDEAAPKFWLAVATVGGALLLLTFLGDINRIGPHYFYRDRLLETYLRTEFEQPDKTLATFTDAMDMKLADLHGSDPPPKSAGNSAPYLLISAAINLSGSRDLTRKDRKSGYFLFSKYYCGSSHTGYRETEHYRGGGTPLSRAITISGAAAGTGMGYHTFFAQSFLTAMFNIRLGYWMRNPLYPSKSREGDRWVVWPTYILREVFGSTKETTRLVNLSDGGHTGDNVGIYPLFERRCQVIIACDAEADGGLAFGSFTEALRHAYVDLGVDVDIDLSMLQKDPETGRCRSHCAIGRIRYPECPDRPNWLIYLKNSITGDEPAPVLNYLKTHEAFPHESTADQFFDDAQFESYRVLGAHIAESAFAEWVDDDKVRSALRLTDPEARAHG